MDTTDITNQPNQKTLTVEEETKNFITIYNKLCKQFGLQLMPQLIWIPTNHGSFEVGVQLVVIKIDKK